MVKQNDMESLWKTYKLYFQFLLGVWQIFSYTPPAAVMRGVMRRLLSLQFPGFFPDYERLKYVPGCLFKTVKCVVLTNTQPKTKNQVNANTGPIEQPSASQISNESTIPSQKSKANSMSENSAISLLSVYYLREKFEVERREGNKLWVKGKMSHYISGGQWEKICEMKKKCFKKEEANERENKVVFLKRCKFIWEKVATGDVMTFEEVLDYVIFENTISVFISEQVSFLPVDLSEQKKGKLPKLLNLLALIPRVNKALSGWVSTSLSIAAALLQFSEHLRSLIYGLISKPIRWLVQYICNKLPYPKRKWVYLLCVYCGVQNMKPRNDILLRVVRRPETKVVIGGAAKTNNPHATPVDWLAAEKTKYFHRGRSSFFIKATYNIDKDDVKGKCKVTVQHTKQGSGAEEKVGREDRVFVKCKSEEQFQKIGTFLKYVADSDAGSLLNYDYNDNKVHVRSWKDSVRHYAEAGFPEVYTLSLEDVIV